MEEICKNWTTWLKKTRFSYMDEIQVNQTLNWLMNIRDIVLDTAELKENQRIADFGCGSGLLAFGVLERFQDKVELIFSDKFQDCLEECKKLLTKNENYSNVKFLKSDLADIKLENNYLDRALTRSVLVHIKEKQPAFNELYRVLKEGGIYCAFEPIISENTRYYQLLKPENVTDYEDFKRAEKEFMENPSDPLVNFSAQSLNDNLENAGFKNVLVSVNNTNSTYIAKKDAIINWFIAPPAPDQKTMKQRYLEYFDEKKVDNFIKEVIETLGDKKITVCAKTAIIKAIK